MLIGYLIKPCSYSAFDNYFLAAQTLREELKHEMDTIFARPNPLRGPKAVKGASLAETPGRTGVDVLLYPSAISAAPTFEQALEASQGTGSYVQDVLTVPASLAGLPAASCPVPMPGSDQLPVGVQVVGQWGDDDLVLDVAEMLESE